MTAPGPKHLADALRRPGYLFSSWPWRAWAYLISTVPIAGVLGFGLFLVGGPFLASVNTTAALSVVLTVYFILGSVLVLALAPVVSFPVAVAERWRLLIVDGRPLPSVRWPGLIARYTTAAAWKEVAYTFWLATVVPLAYGIVWLAIMLDLSLVASPWLARSGQEIVVFEATVDTPGEALPYAIVAALLIPVFWYVLGAMAAVQGAVARWLLAAATDSVALREVTQSRARLVDAYEAERRRIERDMHDGAQTRLTSLTLQLGLAKLDTPEDSPAAKPLAIAHDQAKGLMVLLRQIVHGIRPQSLTDLGLAGAVRELADGATVAVTVRTELPVLLPESVESTAYFVVSESLANVARHAGATQAEVRLSQSGGTLVVEVADDGRGGADPSRGTGLVGLADRVGAANGRLFLSSPVGGPTLVRVELPCRS